MARNIVAVNRQGRITLPVNVRRLLGIDEGTQLEVKVENNTVHLRRATVVPDEDRWAYTPAAVASLRRALADVKAGRLYRLSAHHLETGNYPHRRRRRAK